ncbi:Uncharacterised protein [Chlamydia trachomatis]|nr:Uncharacterised protein [Chlamydia trachomatis]
MVLSCNIKVIIIKKQMVEYFLQYIDELDQILIIQAVFKNKKEYEFTQMIKVKAGLA